MERKPVARENRGSFYSSGFSRIKTRFQLDVSFTCTISDPLYRETVSRTVSGCMFMFLRRSLRKSKDELIWRKESQTFAYTNLVLPEMESLQRTNIISVI